MIYGCTGAGKTTFARRLSERTGIPWYSVDDLTFEPNWVTVPDEVQRRRITDICARPEWILDTAYGKWIDVPLQNVELIVGLDYPRWFSLARLMRRTLARMFDKRPICNGNTETFKTSFSRESIILWHFKSFDRKRARMLQWEGQGRPTIVRFRSAREAQKWLTALQQAEVRSASRLL
jgi:adenylate kinase family enzyme